MRKHELYPGHHDFFEWEGTREIMRIRRQGEKIVRQDWIVFDTVAAALAFFNTKCGAFVGDYSRTRSDQGRRSCRQPAVRPREVPFSP